MADIDYDDYEAAPRITGGQAQRLVHLAGAACSLALIAGMAFWGYKLAVRDVTGVPVIRAAEGPMRIAPSNPGGSVADHQGMAVNVVAAAGGAGDLPEEIVLAPAPIDLSAEDVPGLAPLDPLAEAAPAAAPLSAATGMAGSDPVGLDGPVSDISAVLSDLAAAPDATAPAAEDAVALALAEALGGAAPLAPLAEEPVAEAAPDGMGAAVIRPRPRPGTALASTPAALAAAEPVNVAVAIGPEVDVASLAVGTRLVQLGAFDSAEIARAEWVRLRDRFGDLMTGKSLVVQSAQSGGRTFYRLRAHGFAGEDDSRRFCAALLAENAPCIPAVHR
ncbi:SPOR domain-containing protein [Pseudotabrizicola algicola]|uniref:SPOR domain-containing protein n=1 Tax=Pseudotabrizicola algicola TaxID=2709381 RepID=A0A6B3RI79_9RHOB|nr:SPOR domain-containing protein [Pseudotabrizicola algicola]NEX44896.1 SPOR domain-containing protein [Pseudotabrizicola algicola]